jgi:hypothetical protein
LLSFRCEFAYKDRRMTFNTDKFKALVHYICRACADPSKLGKVKLHKILWYSDGSHFLRRGEPITGETYIKKQYGAFAIHLEDVVAELVHEGRLVVNQVPYFGKEKTEFIAKGDSDKGVFSEKELAIVDTNIEYICEDHTAASISERTHNEIWEMAALNEPLPYEALLVARFLEPTEDDFCWAKDEIAKLR